MAKASKLAKFTVTGSGDTYRLHVEDDGGGQLELEATRDQLDIIVDTLDDILSADDSADEVEGDGEFEQMDDGEEEDEVKTKKA